MQTCYKHVISMLYRELINLYRYTVGSILVALLISHNFLRQGPRTVLSRNVGSIDIEFLNYVRLFFRSLPFASKFHEPCHNVLIPPRLEIEVLK